MIRRTVYTRPAPMPGAQPNVRHALYADAASLPADDTSLFIVHERLRVPAGTPGSAVIEIARASWAGVRARETAMALLFYDLVGRLVDIGAGLDAYDGIVRRSAGLSSFDAAYVLERLDGAFTGYPPAPVRVNAADGSVTLDESGIRYR